MLNELARVAAYGASASAGRDMYRYLRDRGVLAVFLAGIFLTVFGFRHMVMGHNRGFFGTLFLTIIGSILMILLGLVFVIPGLILIFTYTQDIGSNPHGANVWITLGTFAAYVVLSTAIGLIWGFRTRSARKRAAEIENHNIAFLDEVGFRDLGVGDDIIEDGEGNRLKLRDEEDNLLVFTVVNRRNVRAAIELDDEGRMLSYTGAVRL